MNHRTQSDWQAALTDIVIRCVEQRGITRTQLANMTGLTDTTIRHLLRKNSRAVLKTDKLLDIIRLLGYNIDMKFKKRADDRPATVTWGIES